MSNIEFYMAVDGGAPKPVSIEQIATITNAITAVLRLSEPSSGDSIPAARHTESRRGFPETKPPKGERTIDYASRAALQFNGEGFTVTALRDKMFEIGWKTKSTSPRDQVNVVRSTIKGKHGWSYNEENQLWHYQPTH